MLKQTIMAVVLAAGSAGAAAAPSARTDPRPATAPEEQAVVDALKRRLKVPDSVQVSHVMVGTDGETVCGYVDAQNSFGAYTGSARFMALVFPPTAQSAGKPIATVIGIDSGSDTASSTLCARAGL